MKKLYLIDQRDSFVYNLAQLLREGCGADVRVLPEEALVESDALDGADGVVLSPGPGTVEEHPLSLGFLRRQAEMPDPLPVLGVCMGHQEIGTLYGMELYRLDHPRHGVASRITWRDRSYPPMTVGRYHSWALRETDESRSRIRILADTVEDGVVMAIRHRTLPLTGLQFHPESILTPQGGLLLRDWCRTL